MYIKPSIERFGSYADLTLPRISGARHERRSFRPPLRGGIPGEIDFWGVRS